MPSSSAPRSGERAGASRRGRRRRRRRPSARGRRRSSTDHPRRPRGTARARRGSCRRSPRSGRVRRASGSGRLGVAEERVGHAERGEEPLARVRRRRTCRSPRRHDLARAACSRGSCTRRPCPADATSVGDREHPREPVGVPHGGTPAGREPVGEVRRRREPRRVVDEVAHRDLVAPRGQLGDAPPDRVVERERAVVGEERDARGHELLRDRPDVEDRVGARAARPSAIVGRARRRRSIATSPSRTTRDEPARPSAHALSCGGPARLASVRRSASRRSRSTSS